MLLLSSVLALTAASRSAPSAEHAVPSSLPVNASARVVIVGSGFDAGAAAPRCALASGDWDLDDAAKAPVPATIHNSTHASCVPPRMRLGGSAHLTLALTNDTTGTVSVPLEYYPLLSATVSRRPYTSESVGAVLVRVHPSVAMPSVFAELLLEASAPLTLLAPTPVSPEKGAALSLSFRLPLNTTTSAWGAPLLISLYSHSTIVAQVNSSLVLLGHSVPNQAVVDFETRSVLSTDGFVPLGPANGFDSHFEAAAMVQSPGLVWELAARGFNLIVLDGTTDLTISLTAMDLLGDAGIRVLYLLREYADQNVQNTTTTWRHLVTNVQAVKDHPALLGWYVWDDCCSQYKNMAPRYRALKSLDAHHPLFAPFIDGGAEYLYSRDTEHFAPDGWDTASDVFMYESYVLPHPVQTMDTPRAILRYPLDWQPLFVMGELSDLQDLSVSESPAEAQLMHYLQYIAGVVGQVWFVQSDSTPRKLLDGVATSGAQMNALAPALNGKVTLPSAEAVSTAPGTSVYARVMPMGADAGCWAVLVANGAGEPVVNPAINITLPPLPINDTNTNTAASTTGPDAVASSISEPDGRAVSVMAPFENNRIVNASVGAAAYRKAGVSVLINEPLLAFGTQAYLISQGGGGGSGGGSGEGGGCMWAEPPQCSRSSNVIDNCGFEDQHVLGVPDNWLLTMVEVSDPYAGSMDPWASLNTDGAYARSGWYSLRYTSSKPHASRLQSNHFGGNVDGANIRPNSTYALELWASAPSHKTPVSLLVVLNQGTGPDTPIVWPCPVGRDWTRCQVTFTTSAAPKPSLQLQMSSAGTVWLDDVSLIPSCDHPATPPTRTYPLQQSVQANYWRFTVLDSWNADGSYGPEPAKGEGPAIEYIQFKSATSIAGAGATATSGGGGEAGNEQLQRQRLQGRQEEDEEEGSDVDGWVKDTTEWSVSGNYHPNGPIAHLVAPCDGGFWNAGGTPQPWSAIITLPAARGFSGFRFADAFTDDDHLRSFVLEAANSTGNATRWRLVLNESGLPNHRP